MAQKIFLVYSVDDAKKVRDFKKKAKKHSGDLTFSDLPVSRPFAEDSLEDTKSKITGLLKQCSAVICLVGKCTYMNKWVDWEIKQSMELKKKIISVRIHSSIIDRMPDSLDIGKAAVFDWDIEEIVKAVKTAAG